MMSAESPGQKHGFKSFLSNVLRPKKSRQTLRKGRSTTDLRLAARPSVEEAPPVPELAPLHAHRLKYKELHAQVDSQLGERRDYTEIIHTIGALDVNEISAPTYDHNEDRPPGEGDIASLPPKLWAQIAGYLNPAEAASLAFANITLYRRLDGPRYFKALDHPDNHTQKINFLSGLDISLPHHLLCFPCVKYHRRTQEGKERIRPTHVLNPLFNCPNSTNALKPPPHHRITHGRNLPFTFVQLVMRAHRFGPSYGLAAEELGRRWQRDDWSHTSRFHINAGRLLMRVTSQTFADPGLTPSAQRMLLYSREDYWPYFSSCAHWRDGELMPACKCALEHIPRPRTTDGLQGLEHRVKDRIAGQVFDPNALTTLCGFCRPMRRCPECPTEYLIEVKLSEDLVDRRFKQCIVVTRWSDLGDGTTPGGIEWEAINGKTDAYDSFVHYAKRGIASIFEAAFTADTLPGQRVVSLNPKKIKLGEAGNQWY
ncbi:hypothetical protein N7517_006852 [Penicillium concentricum]|uniref:F-box domain-containing protein n=1 Tax=Penicillium concentricum TaxID=293559 RepID=A0A9W9VCY1_9EURO|nr:uncharacterized protein N7517_006852 [Penicillium concentricum]KAJ5374846.1 hypothetical protein N7517_006852 [Penicillium concentricum]